MDSEDSYCADMRALLSLRWAPGMPDGMLNFRPLQKHTYSNILNILQPQKRNIFHLKNSDIFHISAQNIDC